MSVTEELDNLFGEWKEEQKKEDGYDWKKRGIAIDSFTKDGIVCEDVWNKLDKRKRVLYILREANGNTTEMGETGKRVDGDNFWFKDCVTKDKKITDSIFHRIKEMQMLIQGYNSEAKSGVEVLKEVAYMNLNKRGGGSVVDWKVFNAYIERYKEYIKREIAIIKPDIIICCGTYWSLIDNVFGLYKNGRDKNWKSGNEKDFYYTNAEIKDEKGEEICRATIINIYHPSARISNENYIKRFEAIYKTKEPSIDNGVSLGLSKKYIIEKIRNMDESSEEYLELCDLISNIGECKEDIKLEDER